MSEFGKPCVYKCHTRDIHIFMNQHGKIQYQCVGRSQCVSVTVDKRIVVMKYNIGKFRVDK